MIFFLFISFSIYELAFYCKEDLSFPLLYLCIYMSAWIRINSWISFDVLYSITVIIHFDIKIDPV